MIGRAISAMAAARLPGRRPLGPVAEARPATKARCEIVVHRSFDDRSAQQAHCIIAPRRARIAHLRRPWRANLRQSTLRQPEVAVPASHLRSIATARGYRHHVWRSTCAAFSSTTRADSPDCRCRCIWSDLSFANWRTVFSRALLMASNICLGVSSVMVLSSRSLPSEWHRAPQGANPASVRRRAISDMLSAPNAADYPMQAIADHASHNL
jgi:hypothetical protein